MEMFLSNIAWFQWFSMTLWGVWLQIFSLIQEMKCLSPLAHIL